MTPVNRRGLLLDASPGQIDVEEEQQRAEADDRGVELVMVAHQGVVQEVTVDLVPATHMLAFIVHVCLEAQKCFVA